MTIKEIRVKNFKSLCDKYGREVVAEKMGYADTSYIGQLCTGHGSFGNQTARKIERTLKLKEGWMDISHDGEDPELANYILNIKELLMKMDAQQRAAVLDFARYQQRKGQ